MKYIKHIILTAMAVLLTAGQVWAMQLYVITPSGQVTLEVEPSDSFENIKAKIEDKTGFNPTYQHLYYNHIECYNGQTLANVGITSGGQTLTMTYDFIPARQADGSWKFTMPAANKLLEVQYQYTLTLSHNAGHGTVEIIRPGGSTSVGTSENAFQYCYDCQRHPAYPTVANNGNNNLSGFTNPYVGLNGVGTTNNPLGPWKLEYVGKYSHSEYNFSVSSVRHTYGLNSDEDVPIFLLYQWSSATNQYEPVVYGVACAYSKLNNTHNDDHTLLFVAEGHWGCFLTNNEHTQDLNITFDEDLSSGLPNFVTAATPSLPEGVTDNGNGTYTVVSGTELTIEAIANSAEHYYFNNWTNEADEVYSGSGVVTPSGTKPATSLLTLTITGDTTVRGNFKIDTFHLTLSTNDANMGHIDIGGQQYVSKDTSLTDHQHLDVAAIPEPGYYFVNWTDANGIEKSKNTHIVVIALSDTALTAHFAPYATLQIASNYNAWGTVALQAGTTGNHELTLYDESESTSNHLIPAYTCWFDALTRSQHVIPATKLAEVKGGTISSIKYYAQDPVSWTSNKAIDVYLKEVTNTTLNSLVDKSSCTVVYNGQLNVVDGIVTITFSSPFSYNGGNLLVGIENLEAGDYNCGVRFLGEDVPGASIGGQGGNFTQQDFLPMSTFTYQTAGAIENTDGSYSVISGTEVTVTATPANDYHFVNWTDENSNVMGTDAQLTFTVTGDTTVTGNFAVTFGLPTPGVTPEGNLTVFGGRFLSETGEIVATPALTETGEFIDESVVPVPTATTSPATDLTQTSATLNGAVSNPDNVTVTARGFEWKATTGGTYTAVNATGETMTYSLTGLTANTGYTYRAFVTTASGTNYGDEVTFTTPAAGPDYSCAVTTVGNNEIEGPVTGRIIKVKDHQNNEYKIVQIGNQCWLAENLRTTTSPSTGTYLIPAANANYTYTGKQARWYNNDSATCVTNNYGLLYNWNAAVDTFNTAYGETSVITSPNAVFVTFIGPRRGICPVGWHLPSDAEWTQLTNYVSSQSEYQCGGNSSDIAKALASAEGWNPSSGNCAVGNDPSLNNETGFSAVPAGCFNGSSFVNAGYEADFWSATQTQDLSGLYYAYYRNLNDYSADVYRHNYHKYPGLSVRCLRD